MVRSSKKQNRLAFTMIELIFAIVVVAISIMSLPMMTRVTTQGIENNLVQEAIFASVSEINMATTYIWDENSLIDMNDTSATFNDLSRVIDIDGTQCTNIIGTIIRRPGHIHRRCLDNVSTRVYAGTDYQDSLETPEHDFNAIFEGGGSSQAAYKQEYQSKLTVIRTPVLWFNDPNMKEITVEVQEDIDGDGVADGETLTILRAYSANIGEVAYAWRTL